MITSRSSSIRSARGTALFLAALFTAHAQPLDLAFNPNANGEIYTIAAQPDGKLLVGGSATSFGTVARTRLARLHADGSVDPTLNVAFNGTVWSTALQADGRILVGGVFTT